MNLNSVYEFIEKMNSSNSSNDKLDIMKSSNREVNKTLYYTYNNFLQFGLSSKVLRKRKDLCNINTKFTLHSDMFSLLDSLNYRMLTGHEAIREANGFLHKNKELEELFYLILDRNLKVRVSSKLINKAIPGLIPEFNVALANKYDESTKKKINFEKDTWYVSRKLDGVRCLIVVDEKGKAKSFARSGKQFNTLSLIEKQIESLGYKNVVYDGEMCIVDKEGNEDFQSIMKEINRKDHTIQNGLFQVFDYIPYRMFTKGYGDLGTFSQRINTLRKIFSENSLKNVRLLEQTPIFSFDELNALSATSASKNWEGLMLRKNDLYKGKRSNDILKVKTFFDDEYKVLETFTGPFRYIKEGLEVEEEMLSGVSINHKGNTVRVGSGFSIDQRKHFFKHPEDILDKIITVQYFEESQNQNGEYSLRFPVMKVIHGEKRET